METEGKDISINVFQNYYRETLSFGDVLMGPQLNQISLEFEPYQGQYYLNVNGYTVPLMQRDLKDIAPFVKAQGSSGNFNLRDWFKAHYPLFFKHMITDCDRKGLVIDILQYLKTSSIYSEVMSQAKVSTSDKMLRAKRPGK